MQKLFLIIVITITAFCASAQKTSLFNLTTFSVGFETSLPVAKFNNTGYRLGIGGLFQIQYKISNDFNLILNAGYISYSNHFLSNKYYYSIIPILGGARYLFLKNFYVQGELGGAFTMQGLVTSFSKKCIIYSGGVGFKITKNLDILSKYMGIENSIVFLDDRTAGAVNLRLSYNFSIK